MAYSITCSKVDYLSIVVKVSDNASNAILCQSSANAERSIVVKVSDNVSDVMCVNLWLVLNIFRGGVNCMFVVNKC